MAVDSEEGLGVRGRCQDSQSRGHAAVLSHSREHQLLPKHLSVLRTRTSSCACLSVVEGAGGLGSPLPFSHCSPFQGTLAGCLPVFHIISSTGLAGNILSQRHTEENRGCKRDKNWTGRGDGREEGRQGHTHAHLVCVEDKDPIRRMSHVNPCR